MASIAADTQDQHKRLLNFFELIQSHAALACRDYCRANGQPMHPPQAFALAG